MIEKEGPAPNQGGPRPQEKRAGALTLRARVQIPGGPATKLTNVKLGDEEWSPPEVVMRARVTDSLSVTWPREPYIYKLHVKVVVGSGDV